MVSLAESDVSRLVARALRTGEPLDGLVSEALWGDAGAAPKLWGDWSKEGRHVWDLASKIWTDMTSARRDAREEPDVETVWFALETLASPNDWPRVPNVTWGAIGVALHMKPRAAQYLCSAVQGWRFRGVYGARLVVVAPCRGCGRPHHAIDVVDCIGPCCRGGAA